ncbi:XRE family transcriptional regulator [Ktedonosporobacter rubrisoli]|uniref:XRE family transcriptional regulator n=1 Tax=Ktedonosporobacter rubrisoli TaxID=2509675 RepID=UPI0013EE6FD2|nr:XRE family transcriptional regulator [Ktedonosporobacter rubrisoli]
MKKSQETSPNYLLKSAREGHGWTQEELAEKIGATCVTISRWENGVTFPSHYFCKKLSSLYSKTFQELGLIRDDHRNRRRKYLRSSMLLHTSALHDSPPALSLSSSLRPRTKPIFLFNEPLTNPAEFYGRRCERETLISRTYRRASTSIIGPRRIGKTWLIDYLRLTAPKEFGARFSIGYLDATMPSCRSVTGFVTEALCVLGLPVTEDVDGLISLEKGLRVLKARDHIPVLCIDEFEGFSNKQEFTLDFFQGLRAMTHAYNLVLVVVSRNPLSMVMSKDVEPSGFFNIFEQLMLEPFDAEEVDEFIYEKGRQAGFTEQECEALSKYSAECQQGWPPLRLQLVGKMLLEDKERNKIGVQYWQKFKLRLEEIYRSVTS